MPVTSGALGTNNTTPTRADTFTPQIWSDDVIRAYNRRLVVLQAFRKISFKGKGDSLLIPVGIRGTANVKTPGAQVQVQAATEASQVIAINRHFEASRAIEDIVNVQALPSLRSFYTEDIGYQLANRKDQDMAAFAAVLNGGNGTPTFNAGFIGGDGATLYTSGTPNSTAITDLGVRRIIQRLDDNDVPMDDRSFIMSPGTKNVILGIDRFNAYNFVGERSGDGPIRNGVVGDIYGMVAVVSANVATATGGARANIISHRDGLVCVTQMDVRVQSQYKLEFLADLLVADNLYGIGGYRFGQNVDVPSAGFAVLTPT